MHSSMCWDVHYNEAIPSYLLILCPIVEVGQGLILRQVYILLHGTWRKINSVQEHCHCYQLPWVAA